MEKIMNEEFKNMTPEEIEQFEDAYLMFTSNFIEYIREVHPDVFKRALDYAVTVNP